MIEYFKLVRFSHTVFALPFALASMFAAARGFPSLRVFGLILLAVVFCRNAAMSFNRLVDAKFDKLNPRTEKRHLPAGILSRKQVILFFLLNGLLFLLTTWLLNDLASMLALPTLAVVCFYSLSKRFTWACHLFLGLAVGISPLWAWVAVLGELSLQPGLLGLALLFWVSGFDIIYATQDMEVDKRLGLHSAVTHFGWAGALRISKVLHTLFFITLIILGIYSNFNLAYYLCIILVLALLVYVHFLKKSVSLDALNKDFFLANGAISLMVLLGIFLSLDL